VIPIVVVDTVPITGANKPRFLCDNFDKAMGAGVVHTVGDEDEVRNRLQRMVQWMLSNRIILKATFF